MDREHRGENPFILSYSDMMAALLLIFMLLFTSTMLKVERTLEEHEAEILEREEQANRITVIKDEIIAELSNAFSEQGVNIEIDSLTGAITFKEEDIFFGSGSSRLTQLSRDRIDQVIPIYLNVLLDQRFEGDVTQIIVEGHTDPQPFGYNTSYPRHGSSYIDNLGLSLARAQSVVEYLLLIDYDALAGSGFANLEDCSDQLKTVLTANGASFSRPLDSIGNVVTPVPYDAIANGSFDPSASEIDNGNCRRVEIQFRLNDEQYLREIRDILSESIVGD